MKLESYKPDLYYIILGKLVIAIDEYKNKYFTEFQIFISSTTIDISVN